MKYSELPLPLHSIVALFSTEARASLRPRAVALSLKMDPTGQRLAENAQRYAKYCSQKDKVLALFLGDVLEARLNAGDLNIFHVVVANYRDNRQADPSHPLEKEITEKLQHALNSEKVEKKELAEALTRILYISSWTNIFAKTVKINMRLGVFEATLQAINTIGDPVEKASMLFALLNTVTAYQNYKSYVEDKNGTRPAAYMSEQVLDQLSMLVANMDEADFREFLSKAVPLYANADASYLALSMYVDKILDAEAGLVGLGNGSAVGYSRTYGGGIVEAIREYEKEKKYPREMYPEQALARANERVMSFVKLDSSSHYTRDTVIRLKEGNANLRRIGIFLYHITPNFLDVATPSEPGAINPASRPSEDPH